MELSVGLKSRIIEEVVDDSTAVSIGSGSLPVFATPKMVALMEKASCKAIEAALNEGLTSVGTLVNVEHLSATPKGMKVTVESVVTAVDKRKVCFEVVALDEAGIIGKGTHERFIVDSERFLAKTNAKLQ